MKVVKTNIHKDILSNMTVKVKLRGYYRWKARIWLGTQFIKLGARIMNVGVKIE